jgi:hypothetical protein
MFQRRHYDLLAYWAGRNLDLSSQAVTHLLILLADDNPAFQKSRFIAACETHHAIAEQSKAAGAGTDPRLIEANLDDAISHSEK